MHKKYPQRIATIPKTKNKINSVLKRPNNNNKIKINVNVNIQTI